MQPTSVYYRYHYRLYLQSKEWQKLKEELIYSNPNSHCWICDEKYPLLPHHLKYDNLMIEREIFRVLWFIVGDVVVVCYNCHDQIHFIGIGMWKIKVPIRKYILVKRMKWLRLKHCLQNKSMGAILLATLDCLV